MEFMMTYGWAIIVVLIAIASLSYFGVLRSDRFLPENCILPPGITCLDFKVETSTISLLLQNTFGEPITIEQVNVTAKSGVSCVNNTLISLAEDQQALVIIPNCASGAIGQKFDGDIGIMYTRSSTLSRTHQGALVTEISSGSDGSGGGSCGNSICDAGETASSCPGDCPAQCGDNACTHSETCTSCPGDCGSCLPQCGNSIVEGGEECDDGNSIDTDSCKNNCTNNICGDGVVNIGVEQCDDGNTANGDGCSSTCQNELPTAGFVQVSGTSLALDGNPYLFYGVNVYGAG